MTEISGFEILHKIYESSNSQVFRALRNADGLPVVLKVLNPEHPTPEEILRYRQEYRITSGLSNVAGVIQVYGIERFQNSLVMILEDFGGDSFDKLEESLDLSLKEWISIAIRVVEILGRIHAAHVIHKDVNPSNMVFNAGTGDLKIIDFGISTILSRENPTAKTPHLLEGTLAYVSPEQTGRMNRSVDYRTDYYSLGATLYELFTGQPPFQATDTLELVYHHVAKLPELPSVFNNRIPDCLCDVVIKLLAKNPEERYQSAIGIRKDLEECIRHIDAPHVTSRFSLAHYDVPERFQVPEKLYGREHEIEALMSAFQRVGQGAKELLLVAGRPGIGKTSLIREDT